jgi:hypothetical protein
MGSMSLPGSIVVLFTLLSLIATATAATGTIHIYVHPGGGTVCLDTVCKPDQGTVSETGSTTFDNIEAGSYHMLNIYGTPGYQPYLKQIYLDAGGTPVTRDIVLEKVRQSAPETGSIRVFITPDGGKVCLDRMCEVSSGNRSGSWSVEFPDVTANTYHTLTVTNEGYGTYTSEIRLLPGQTSTMDIVQKPLPPGSTPLPTPTPVSTPAPAPTRAALPGFLALFATGICGIILVLKHPGQW